MDGGRRVLRSVKESFATALPRARHGAAYPAEHTASPAAQDYFPGQPVNPNFARTASRRRGRASLASRFQFLARPGVGPFSIAAIFVAIGLAGFVQNGGYAKFVSREGAPWDIAARVVGFPINAVTISGQSRLTEQELLIASGVTARDSLPFLDIAAVRDRLMSIPLVKSAQVMKLYPNRLVVAIEERQPHALWQRDGKVVVVSQDGVPIDEVRDARYLSLPFVVGDGAQKRMVEFSSLMQLAGDLAPRVKAGILVAGRRWNFQMTNGVVVKLPEQDPGAAVETLQRLQREARILDKDLMSIDLRVTDRVFVRLTADAAAAREATASIKKSHTSGG
jgi:cell division protein FtsQ